MGARGNGSVNAVWVLFYECQSVVAPTREAELIRTLGFAEFRGKHVHNIDQINKLVRGTIGRRAIGPTCRSGYRIPLFSRTRYRGTSGLPAKSKSSMRTPFQLLGFRNI